jgi:hypothetical protein
MKEPSMKLTDMVTHEMISTFKDIVTKVIEPPPQTDLALVLASSQVFYSALSIWTGLPIIII